MGVEEAVEEAGEADEISIYPGNFPGDPRGAGGRGYRNRPGLRLGKFIGPLGRRHTRVASVIFRVPNGPVLGGNIRTEKICLTQKL